MTDIVLNQTRMTVDKFGFLPQKWSLKFDEFKIEPLQEYELNEKEINESPFLEISGNQRFISHTSTFSLPSSHQIVLSNHAQSLEEFRRGIGGFVVHLLGYLFGRRFQFENWQYDSRVPLNNHHNLIFNAQECEDFLSLSVQRWRILDAEKQKLISNLLFMHCRAISYLWDWERFTIQYIVLDGICRFVWGEKVLDIPHKKRLKTILEKYQMVLHEKIITNIVNLRNDLFHESLWDRGQPCTARSVETFHAHYNLKRIVERLIPAILDYPTEYINSDWFSKSPDMLKKYNSKGSIVITHE